MHSNSRKESKMEIDYKAAGARVLEDDGGGVVTAIVSVTGIKDNVNDIIVPGAYAESLKKRKPKGVWHHSWEKAIAKTLEVKELMPGDELLPRALPDGTPWPKEAGGLMVKMQFNLNTPRGRDAYEDVKFFADDQEWSIGYSVPATGATRKEGVRYIKRLELFEYSPVLFGAMSNARTVSIKSAQTAWQELVELKGAEAEQFVEEVKSLIGEEFKGKRTIEDDDDHDIEDILDDLDEDDDDPDGDEFPDEDDDLDDPDDLDDIREALCRRRGKKSTPFTQEDTEKLRGLLGQLKEVLEVEVEEEVVDLPALAEAAELPQETIEEAEKFEEAVDAGDVEAAEKHANAILDVIEPLYNAETKEALDPIGDYLYITFGGDQEAKQVEPEEVEMTKVILDLTEYKDILDN